MKLVWVLLHQPPQLHDHQRHQDLRCRMKKNLSLHFQRAQSKFLTSYNTHTANVIESGAPMLSKMIHKLDYMKRHEGEIEPITENECTVEQALVDTSTAFTLFYKC